MSSGITFSGFNNVDFNMVLNALMKQAAIPLNQLQAKQAALKSQQSNLDTLSSKLSALSTAASTLSRPDSLASATATTSDTSAVAVSTNAGAVPGHYDIVVRDLARAQVTASQSTAPDADTTAVASGGSLQVAGTTINITQPVTLRQLAQTINDSAAPVRATVVASGNAQYRLVLTAENSGVANAFTVTNGLTGGSGITFADGNGDGRSGDTAADNAVQATNADLSVNNIAISSASNTLSEAIPGVSLTLLRSNPTATVAVDVASDASAVKSSLASFVSAYNSFQSFYSTQSAAARSGDDASIGKNPMVRGLQQDIKNSLLQAQTTGGRYTNLSQIGLEFNRTGQLEVNDAKLTEAMSTDPDAVRALLSGGTSGTSAFARVASTLDGYTRTSGLISSVKNQLTDSISRLGGQIDVMTQRLLLQRKTLQKEFTEAEAAMSQLKNQSGNLGSISSSLTSAV